MIFRRGDSELVYNSTHAAVAPQCVQFVPGKRESDTNPCWCSQVCLEQSREKEFFVQQSREKEFFVRQSREVPGKRESDTNPC